MIPAGFSPLQFLLLGAAIFCAGFVDAVAGGGGLITVPAYLAAGLPPIYVLGTNKFVSSMGTFAAILRYRRSNMLTLRGLAPALAAGIVAAVIGAKLATLMNPAFLRPILLVALPILAWIVWSRHDFGEADQSGEFEKRELRLRTAAVAAPVALYDGFFGPGAGTFYALGLTKFARYDLLGATARAKALNGASNLAALAAFIFARRVMWSVGAPMILASVAGNWLGARFGSRGGAPAIRPIVAAVTAALFLKILFDAARGLIR